DQHDINPELYEVKFGKRGFFHRLLRVFERLTFFCADGSLATNETLKQRAIDKGRMDADRVWVVQSFPDLARFQPTEPDSHLLPEFRHRVGYVGIMAEQDGVDLLVKAMAHIVHGIGRTDIGCAIIGDGPELERLKALANELDISNVVQFTGYLSGSDLLSKLCACDVG
ncbi:MAG: glycosyltransferase family 4 protein, partial [bacterium]|nr:glycosyltransferase family 4 protein [bacterium]